VRIDEVEGKKKRALLDERNYTDTIYSTALSYELKPEDVERAKFSYADGILRHKGQISWDPQPGRSTGLLAKLYDASPEVREQFLHEATSLLVDENGVDLLAQKLGLLKLGSIDAPGVWKGDVAPGRQELFVMATGQPGEGGGAPELSKAQIDAVESYCAIIGYLFHQEGVGYHRSFYNGKKADENGLAVKIGRPFTDEEAESFYESVDATLKAAGFPEWEQSVGLISSDDGMRLISFGLTDNPAATKLFSKAVEGWQGPVDRETLGFRSPGRPRR
jgi:hypothetical protein